MVTESVILNYVKEKKVRVVYDIRPEANLTFLIGMPRCGKSTFAEYIKDTPRLIVHNDDNLRLAWYNKRYSGAGESLIHSAKYPILKAGILSGYHVVSDDTHTTAQNILRLLAVDKNASFIFFDVEPELCKKRATLTYQTDLFPVIDRSYANLKRTFGSFDSQKIVATINGLRSIADKPLKEVLEERIISSL